MSLRNGGWSGESRNISLGNRAKIVGQEFSLGPGSITCSESKACRKVSQKRQLQRMNVMKDTRKKIRSKERMDANNSWWVTELLAADCEKAWLHPGWEDTVLRFL